MLTLNGTAIELDLAETMVIANANGTKSTGYSFRIDRADLALPGLLASAAGGSSFNNALVTQYSGRLINGRNLVEAARWELGAAKINSASLTVQGEESPILVIAVSPSLLGQTIRLFDNNDVARLQHVWHSTLRHSNRPPHQYRLLMLKPSQISARVSLTVVSGYVDLDNDLVDDGVERSAPQNGDGNRDGVRDDQQNNVTSLPHPVSGNFVTLAAPNGQKLNNVNIVTPLATPPRDIDFRIGLLQYELTSAPANSVLQRSRSLLRNNRIQFVYKYGPTADNPTPHYYRFLYDGSTGAEILSDRIIVHLKDGSAVMMT